MYDSRFIKIKRRKNGKSATEEKNANEEIINIDSDETIGSQKIKTLMSSERTLFLSLLTLRIFNSMIIQTSSVPDEYWQSVEVAHKMVFNIGYLTWEWHPDLAIRSPIYPLLFAGPFKLLDMFGLSHRLILIKLPMIMHGIMAACSDYYLYLLAFKLAGQQVAQWTLVNQLINWFIFYLCPRTLSNCVEWLIVVLTLHEYHRIAISKHQILSRRFLFYAGITFIFRPTGLLIMLPVVGYHCVSLLLYNSGTMDKWRSLRQCLSNAVIVCVFILTISLLADKHYYGRWTCSQLNFLRFNLLTDLSQNYGVHPWHWYLSNGLPAMFTTQLIPLVVSLFTEWNDHISRKLIVLMFMVIYLYSLLGHKEFRFIFPLMPIGMYLLGRFFARFSFRKCAVIFLILTHIPMTIYMCLIHQRGTLDVVMAIGRYVEQQYSDPRATNVLFLMPCHSTPWSSHLHYNISARFLTCDPQISGGINFFNDPISTTSLRKYDEADLFYKNPIDWLETEYSFPEKRPTFIVMFEQLGLELNSFLLKWNYSLCKRFFHAHIPTHSKHSTKIVVFCAYGFVL